MECLKRIIMFGPIPDTEETPPVGIALRELPLIIVNFPDTKYARTFRLQETAKRNQDAHGVA